MRSFNSVPELRDKHQRPQIEIYLVTYPDYEGVNIELVTTSFADAVEKLKSNPTFVLEVWENGGTKEKKIYYKIDDMVEDGRIIEVAE